MKAKRIIAIALTAIVALGAASCGGNTSTPSSTPTPTQNVSGDTATPEPVAPLKQLKLTMTGRVQSGSRTPVEDLFTPIWREKTGVEIDIIPVNDDQDKVQWLQLQDVAGSIPHIIQGNGYMNNSDVFGAAMDMNILREITLDDIYTYMPLTVQRLQNWGVDIEAWFAANLDVTSGKMMYFPQLPEHVATNLVNDQKIRDGAGVLKFEPYAWYFRDDILKQIFPEAKTEAELQLRILETGNNCTFEDVNDIPIYNMDDLYDYLTKVKALGVTVEGKPVTPAQIQMGDMDSIWWSTFTIADMMFQDLGQFVYNDTNFSYFADTPNWKNYMKWLNVFYNDGLLSTETFIQKDDQRDAKVVNGEYAVFQSWLNAGEARNVSKEEGRGYGFRKVFLFHQDTLSNNLQDASNVAVSLRSPWGGYGITTTVADGDYAQVLGWLDWNLSEEANILRAWGPEEFYTGDGMDRRFKPEYEEVELWARGRGYVEGGKDGLYYGMYSDNAAYLNDETFGITAYYEYGPTVAYPSEIAEGSDPATFDTDWVTSDVTSKHYSSLMNIQIQSALGEDALDLYRDFDAEMAKFNDIKATQGYEVDGAYTSTLQAIIGPVDKFEENYAKFEDGYLSAEFKTLVDSIGQKYLAYYNLVKNNYWTPME